MFLFLPPYATSVEVIGISAKDSPSQSYVIEGEFFTYLSMTHPLVLLFHSGFE